MATNFQLQAQPDWNTGGNAIGAGAFLGSTTAQHLNFTTNNLQRAQINGFNNGGFGSWINNTGYTIIGVPAPLSPFIPLARLHLGMSCINHNGWRPWMQEGTFVCAGYQGAGDQAYFGLKQNEDDPTNQNREDAVVTWETTPRTTAVADPIYSEFYS